MSVNIPADNARAFVAALEHEMTSALATVAAVRGPQADLIAVTGTGPVVRAWVQTASLPRGNTTVTGEVVRVAIRPIGNSKGVSLPKSLLAQAGLGDESTAEMTVEDGAIVLRKAVHPLRAGWAEAAMTIATKGGDKLAMGEFGNETDAKLAW